VELNRHKLATGISGGLAEDEPLAADRVLENLSSKRHFRSLLGCFACWLT
jgi:hypothetical protein